MQDHMEGTYLGDRWLSEESIKKGDYEHADRSFREYCIFFPELTSMLDQLVQGDSQVFGLDAGCGTGYAARGLEIHTKGKVMMYGATLVRFPPIQDHVPINAERIIELPISRLAFPDKFFHIIFAVGSLDTSHTFDSDGPNLLRMLHPDGVLCIAETGTWSNTPSSELRDFNAQILLPQGYRVHNAHSLDPDVYAQIVTTH